MKFEETDDEYFARVKASMMNAKPGEMVFLSKGEPAAIITTISDMEIQMSGHGEQQRSFDHGFMYYKGKLKKFIPILLCFLLFTSCAVTYYTHDQVMDKVFLGQTKDFVITNFGMPDDKAVEGEYEQWLYDRGQKTVISSRPSRSTTTATVTPGFYNVAGRANTSTYGGGSTSRTYTSYVKLIFKDGVIVSWLSQGVDYSETVYGK